MSSYEEQRKSRLERNLQVMTSLGLVGPQFDAVFSAPPQQAPAQQQEKYILPEELRRRSTRNADGPKPVYFAKPASATASAEAPELRALSTRVRKRVKHFIREDDEEEEEEVDYPSEEEEDVSSSDEEEEEAAAPRRQTKQQDNSEDDDGTESSKKKKVSCYQLSARVPEEQIGTELIPPLGVGAYKEFVITSISPAHVRPVFNRYSGIQAFENCVVLFANVATTKKSNDYSNSFVVNEESSVVFMDWFAAARTPQNLISRLNDNNELLFLFLRVEGEPYLCAGPVTVVERENLRYRLQLANGPQHPLMRDAEAKQRFMRLVHFDKHRAEAATEAAQ